MFDLGPGLSHVRAGRLNMLAVGRPQRSSAFPDIPTLDELGLKGFDADTVFGFYAPGATPPAVVEQLHRAINQALQTDPVQSAMKRLGTEAFVGSRDAFVTRNEADRVRYGRFIREAGIKAD